MSVGTAAPVLEPLDLKCTNSDCENDLHCFLRKTRKRMEPRFGPCRHCGKDLVDFPRVQARDVGDVAHTFESLSREWIRHMLWHLPFDQRALNHARRKGRRQLFDDIEKRLRQSVGKTRHPREGRQTPFEGNVIFYAQHSVAACCRKCIEYWHGIAMGAPLENEHVGYLKELIVQYVEQRFPDLNEDPVKVPSIRKAAATAKEAPRKASNG